MRRLAAPIRATIQIILFTAPSKARRRWCFRCRQQQGSCFLLHQFLWFCVQAKSCSNLVLGLTCGLMMRSSCCSLRCYSLFGVGPTRVVCLLLMDRCLNRLVDDQACLGRLRAYCLDNTAPAATALLRHSLAGYLLDSFFLLGSLVDNGTLLVTHQIVLTMHRKSILLNQKRRGYELCDSRLQKPKDLLCVL